MGNRTFVIRNLLKGFLWFVTILGVYLLFKEYVNINFLSWLEPVFENNQLMYFIFLVSEVVIGIIPPEIFFIWALRFEPLSQFLLVISALALTSYLAGVIGYFIGRYLNNTLFYRYFRRRFLKNIEKRLNQFGLYLIIIASLTPLPFSGVAMMVGSVRYNFLRYLLYSLFRFVRFWGYAWIFWKFH